MFRPLYSTMLAVVLIAPVPLAGQTSGPAAEVIERYITALGGREALSRARTVEFVRERHQFGTVARVYRIEDLQTKRFYQRVDSPDGMQEQGYDGQRVWQKRPAFRGFLSEDELLTRQVRNPEPDIREYRESGRTYAILQNERIDGVEYLVLGGIQRQPIGGDVPVKFYFDPATHLLRRRSFGNAVQVFQTFDDYRSVDGVLVAFEISTQQPQGTVVVKTKLHRLDVPVADSLFAYRETAKPIEPPATDSSASSQPVSLDVRRATFNYVWEKTRDTYWDPTFGGVDWNAVRARYLPLAESTVESKPFHAVLARMVGELHVTHFHVRPPEAIITERTTTQELAARPSASPGMAVRYLDGQVVVFSVDSGGPAERAGIRPGFVIDSVDGRSIESIVAAWRAENPDFELRRLTHTSAVNGALRGPAAAAVRLSLVDEQGRHISREVGRHQRPVGVPQMTFEPRRLPSGLGYVRWNIFLNDAVEQFQRALDSLSDTPGLIVDLRANPGGVGVMARAIASVLMRESGSLGTAVFRHGIQHYVFQGSGDGAYTGRVVILVDEQSGSTSEVFAAGLQDLHRAIVIGDTTAGAVLPSNADVLPSGGIFQHPVSNYVSAGGATLEGRGVIPDIIARPTRESLLQGRDIVLERAVQYLDVKSSARGRASNLP